MTDRPYKATGLINENIIYKNKRENIFINVSFGNFKTKETAEMNAKSAKFFFENEKDPLIRVNIENTIYYIRDEDITIDKVKKKIPSPIDSSTEDGRDKITEILLTMDKEYLITDKDLEEIPVTLKDLSNFFKNGKKLDNIAYGVE